MKIPATIRHPSGFVRLLFLMFISSDHKGSVSLSLSLSFFSLNKVLVFEIFIETIGSQSGNLVVHLLDLLRCRTKIRFRWKIRRS